ncbi:hypothetical protein C0Q70_21382 [Pomacea canaliculata]|uniref:B30.2/SPRY domain-containing protein n=2 Tax=Pomacea canaliculata TaxID=400727 RepID=A0A2T7NCD1_POMCA|nr:hypothetical protein C0Q70_21382 [Pomacea canaliculata]
MASFHTTLLCKEYTSYCCCARVGRSKHCVCGEDDMDFCWTWDPDSTHTDTSVQEDGREVLFHTNYSRGTAAIRGTEPFREGHHFWEVKMTTPVYGTDMMIGVATEEMELDKYRNSFCSLLGRDRQSWGLSYLGNVHHMGRTQPFSEKIGQGAIVGVHLDMWHGTLSYYLNRKPLGVAYHGLRGKVLYPVVSSTAARSGMKVICTRSFPSTLQFLCCMMLRRQVHHNKCVLDVIKVPPGLSTFLHNNLSWLLRSQPCTPLLPPKLPSCISVDRATQAQEDDFKINAESVKSDKSEQAEKESRHMKQDESTSGSEESQHSDDKDESSTSRGLKCSSMDKLLQKIHTQTFKRRKRRRSHQESSASQTESSNSAAKVAVKKSKMNRKESLACGSEHKHAADQLSRTTIRPTVSSSGQPSCSDVNTSVHGEPRISWTAMHDISADRQDLDRLGQTPGETAQRIPVFPSNEDLTEMNSASAVVDGMFKAFSEFMDSQSGCSSESDYAANRDDSSTETEESSDTWSPCKKRHLM